MGKLKQLDLCSGVGAGFPLAGLQLGLELVGLCEWDEWCRDILKQRFPGVLQLRDVKKYDWTRFERRPDIITASSPCQPFSIQGKRQGAADERDCIPAVLEAVEYLQPQFFCLENVTGLLSCPQQPGGIRGSYFRDLLLRLHQSGYDAEWLCLGSGHLGAPFRRERLLLVGFSRSLVCKGKRAAPWPEQARSAVEKVRRVREAFRNGNRAGRGLRPGFPVQMLQSPANLPRPLGVKSGSARQPEIFSTPELLLLPSSEFSISIPSEGQDSNFAPRRPLEGSAQNFSPTKAQAISLWQPWASLIAMGLKQWETRSWKTNYRGKLVICAARKVSGSQCEEYIRLAQKYGIDLDRRDWESLPKGCAIALCDLTDCVVMTPEWIAQQSEKERDCGNWQPGRYAWKLENVVPLEPAIPVRGKQRLWEIDLETVGLNFSPTKKRGRKPGSKNSRPASGSLGPTVQRKNGKSYPAIEGERVSKDLAWDYPEQFVWLYNWSVQDSDGCWKNRSKRVPVGKIYSVSRAIALGKPVEEILRMI